MDGNMRQEIVWEHFCRLVSREDLNPQREMTLEYELAHAAGTARLAQVLAAGRNLDRETAFILGVLHDYGRILTGSKKDHARTGSTYAREYLAHSGYFSEEEIEEIVRAIASHSLKEEVGSPLEELIKDADVLDSYLSGRPPSKRSAAARLQDLFKELGIQG